MKLDKQTGKALKLYKAAKKAERKLATHKSATSQQRQAWKRILLKAYRKFPTEAEAKLIEPLDAIGFVHQEIVCGFIPDFACERHKVIVEVDGSVHKGRESYDAHRDSVLQANGWRVLRFTNAEVSASPEQVAEKVWQEILRG